ncbi:hypothetical protein pb186bvf_000398 [Paramecium bursaria]
MIPQEAVQIEQFEEVVQNNLVEMQRPYAIINVKDIYDPEMQHIAIVSGIKEGDIQGAFQNIYIGYDGFRVKLMQLILPIEMIDMKDLSGVVNEQEYNFRLLLHECYKKTSKMVEFKTKFVENLRLPIQVQLLLKDMIKEEKQIHIQDLANQLLTYVYIHKNEPQLIKADQYYLVGETATFLIDQCHTISEINEQNMTYFYQALQGLSYWNNNLLGLYPIQISQFQQIAFLMEHQLFAVIKQYSLPFIQIRFIPDHYRQQNYIIFALNADQDSQVFTLGRGDENDIKIFDDQTSRVQCRIQYKGKEKNWFIYDGTIHQGSTNGTRLLVQTFSQWINRQRSDIIKMREFKYVGLQNLILHVEIIN